MLDYLKAVIDVPTAEEYLQVNKYGQLARKDKGSIVVLLKQICFIHQMLEENIDEITGARPSLLPLYSPHVA